MTVASWVGRTASEGHLDSGQAPVEDGDVHVGTGRGIRTPRIFLLLSQGEVLPLDDLFRWPQETMEVAARPPEVRLGVNSIDICWEF